MNSKLGLSSLLYIKYMDGLKKKKKVEKHKFDAFKHVIKNFKPPSIISLKIESLMKKTKISRNYIFILASDGYVHTLWAALYLRSNLGYLKLNLGMNGSFFVKFIHQCR